MRSLGLDIGDRRIGVAISDPGGIIATPHSIIERTDSLQDIKAILDIVSENDVEQIIVGIPLSMNGTIGEQAKKVESFAEDLKNNAKVPILFRDERLSTVEARRIMISTKRKKVREKTKDDAFAAAVILREYLDEQY